MILDKRLFLFLTLFFFFVHAARSQDTNSTLPLKDILRKIEKQHNVKFSYLDSQISGFKISPPQENSSLKDKLDYIRITTGLHFKIFGDYISIYTPVNKTLICGYVIDDKDIPIEGALIKYLNNNDHALTNEKGYFELLRHDTDYLEISNAGYETITFSAKSFDDCRTIVLGLTLTVLEEIVAERYLTTGITKKSDGSLVMKPRKFGILPGLTEPDVLQTMQQLPGVNSIDETVSNINVRGGTHDQNLFLWNGIRLFQTGHFFGLISALNPSLPHQITIYKNGTSAFYGESVSSVVDISSRSQDIDENSFGIGANMINADFYSVIKLSERSGMELSARRSFTDILDLPTYSKYSNRIFQNTVVTGLNNRNDVNYKSDKEFYFYDFTGQYHHKIGDKNDLFIDIIGIKNNLDFTQGTITSTNVVTKNSSLSQLSLGGSATFKTNLNENNDGEITVYGSYYRVNGRNEALLNSQVLEQENTILDAGLKLSNITAVEPGVWVKYGYQYNELSIKNRDMVNTPDYSRTEKNILRTHALIGELQYDPEDEKFYTLFGLRANYLEQFSMMLLEPRVQLNYTFNNRWKIEVLTEVKSQSTSQLAEVQQDFLGVEKRRWVLANDEDIPVQRSKQFSAGLYYRNKSWQVSIENFYKKVEGITTPEQAFQNQLEFLNLTGSYRVFGSEFLVQKQFHGFYSWLSYTWNNNKYEFKDFEPSVFPNNLDISHTLKCGATYEWKDLKLALGSKLHTGRPETLPLSNEPVYNIPGYPEISYSEPNSTRIETYFEVNLSALYSIELKNSISMQMGVSVMNLLGRKNLLNRYYRINNDTDAIEEVNTYSVERTPNVMVRLRF